MEKEAGKKPIYKRVWFWVLGVVFLLIIVSSSSGGSTPPQMTDGSSTGQQVATGEPAVPEPTWQQVKAWDGSGIKKTEPFTITGKQWRVVWENKGDNYLGIYLYEIGDAVATDVLANTTDAGGDTSYVYKKGEFYLDVNASGPWKITVEELK